MKLVLISPSDKKDSEIPFLINMFENGLLTYHVRKTKYSTRKLREYLSDIPDKYHDRIVIHTHYELATKFNLKGVYVSRSHKKRKIRNWFRMKWLKFKKSELQVSATVRNTENISDSESKYDYVFLSPVFDSLSGNFQAGFSEFNIKSALQNTTSQVIARGGISVDKIQKAHELGFNGVAFYTSIWKAQNPVQEFLQVKAKFAELNLPME